MADPLPFGVGSPAEPVVDQAGTVNALAGAIWNFPKHLIDASANAVPGLRKRDVSTDPDATEPNQPMYNAAGDMALGLMGGSGWAPAEVNSLRMGIKAFHGSPHDFDKFDMSKIGTGEGAQAYGHGLYFAGNPKTAEEYAKRLGNPTINGEKFDYNNPIHRLADYSQNLYFRDRNYLTQSINGDLKEMLHDGRPGDQEQIKFFQAMADHLNAGKEIPKFDPEATRGHRYEVNIHADPTRLLDWDNPIEAQSKHVQDVVRELVGKKRIDPSVAGGAALRAIIGTPAGRSVLLNEEGVPGLKYLDAFSRRAGTPSHNYVAFNDKIIEILKKYGIAGVPAAGAAAGVAQEQEKQ